MRPTTYVSARDIGHLSLECSGLDRMRESGRDPALNLTAFQDESLAALFAPVPTADRFPIAACRVCSIEAVVTEILTRPRPTGQQTVLAMTSLARPTRAQAPARATSSGDDVRRREYLSQARERAHRIAEAGGLATIHSADGPVLYGLLPLPVAALLSDYVAVDAVPTDGAPSADLISTYWTLRSTVSLPLDELWRTAHAMWI